MPETKESIIELIKKSHECKKNKQASKYIKDKLQGKNRCDTKVDTQDYRKNVVEMFNSFGISLPYLLTKHYSLLESSDAKVVLKALKLAYEIQGISGKAAGKAPRSVKNVLNIYEGKSPEEIKRKINELKSKSSGIT